MSKITPKDSELKPVSLFFKSIYIGIPEKDIEIPQVVQENISLVEQNHLEIITWGIFMNAHLGRGVQAYIRASNGEISYPPEYFQGALLMFLNKNDINAVSSYNLMEKTIVGILDQETESFHLLDLPLPDESDIAVLEFEGAEFSDEYTIEKDDAELLRSSDVDFLKSRMAYNDSDYKKALFYLDKVLEQNPNYSRAYSARGAIYQVYQDMRYALANYLDGLEINPNNWRSLYNIGILFDEVGLVEIARKYIEACLEINPDFDQAVNYLSLLRDDCDTPSEPIDKKISVHD